MYNLPYSPLGKKEGKELEEERRVFYVGLTRAKDNLYLLIPAKIEENKKEKEVKPSILLKDLDENCYNFMPYGF